MDQQSESSSRTQNLCYFCGKNESKYSCPRCNEHYCSLECYRCQEHAECSESFYRECVTQQLVGLHADDESKKTMTEILTKIHNNENELADDDDESDLDSDDEMFVAIQERMKTVNLDNPEDVWNALTEDEKNEFEALVLQGDITKLVPLWKPWWSYSEENKLVTELEESKDMKEAMKLCPQIIEVPELTSVSKVKPADCVKYNILNVLTAYAFLMRYFNGEIDSLEFYGYLLLICQSLGKNSNYEDEEAAVASVEHECINVQQIETDKTSLEVMKHDVYLLLRGPCKDNQLHYINCALSDIHRILNEAKLKLKKKTTNKKEINAFNKKFPSHSDQHLPVMDFNKIKMYVKKIEYYLSYLKSYNLPLVVS